MWIEKLTWSKNDDEIAFLYSMTKNQKYYNLIHHKINIMIRKRLYMFDRGSIPNRKDIIQRLHIICYKALLTLNPTKGRPFSYLQYSLTMAIPNYVRAEKRYRNTFECSGISLCNDAVDESSVMSEIDGKDDRYVSFINYLLSKCFDDKGKEPREGSPMWRFREVIWKCKDNPISILSTVDFFNEFRKIHGKMETNTDVGIRRKLIFPFARTREHTTER